MAETLVELVVPPGGEEANHGTQRFRAGLDGHILVTPEAARHLLKNGGYALAKKPAPPAPPPGSALVHHPDPLWAIGLGEPDGNGNFWVPAHVAGTLCESHGCKAGPRPEGEPLPPDAEIAALKAALAEREAEIARLKAPAAA